MNRERTPLDALSLFFPLYNEEGNVEQDVTSALAVLAGLADRYEVIVVNDGGRDRTGAIADRLAAADVHVRVVHHQESRGYGAAVRSGLAAVRYPVVVLADGGNQFDLNELPMLLRSVSHTDIVSGYRIARHDPPFRRVSCVAVRRPSRLLFGFACGTSIAALRSIACRSSSGCFRSCAAQGR
jgi:glycosyltransferase involved in cell wall biosynthesis